MFAAICAVSFGALATMLHLATIAVAAVRCRCRPAPAPLPNHTPAVSLLRPVCGLDGYARETLASSFRLNYSDYEILFCAARRLSLIHI